MKEKLDNSSSNTNYFVMIVHDFSFPVKQVRIDKYYF